jgi:Tol biopolymer transport system component
MGGSFHRVLDNSASVAWSFDGKRLAFHSAEAGDPLYISELDGSKPVEIYRHPDAGHTHNPTWSPTGNLVYLALVQNEWCGQKWESVPICF